MKVIACVYWEGRFRGRENIFTPDWVVKLYNMSERNLETPFRFVCLTNKPNYFKEHPKINTVKLLHDWRGWWSKIELFRPKLFDKGDKVLYLDLDSIILKSIEPLFEFKDNFIMTKYDAAPPGTFKRWDRWERINKTVVRRNSSTTFFMKYPFPNYLYTSFDYTEHSRQFRGDQDWINHKLGENVATYPLNWIKKLRDCENGILPEEIVIVAPLSAKILPKKNQSAAEKYKWANEAWR